MITLDQFERNYSGQSLLWAPSPGREYLRGQCVQLVCFYCHDVVGSDIMWADAVNWFNDFSLGDKFDKIPWTGSNYPKRGDIVIWGDVTPGSGGAGHIDICLSDGDANGFLGLDQNWAGKTVHRVQHNYNWVVGFLRPKGDDVTLTSAGIAESFYRELLDREIKQEEYQYNVGAPIEQTYIRIATSDEHALVVQKRRQVQQERDICYSIAETRGRMLEADDRQKAELQTQLDAQVAALTKVQGEKADLQSKIDNMTTDSIVVTRKGWAGFFDAIRDFFKSKN